MHFSAFQCTANRSQACGTSIATCAPALAKCSPMSRSSILLQLRTFAPLLALLTTPQLFGTLTSAGTTTHTTLAPDTHSARSPLTPWGGSAPAPCSSSVMPSTPPFPSPGTRASVQRAARFANVYRQLPVVQYCYQSPCLRPLQASKPRARHSPGSVACPKASPDILH
jgi:hypothetical protein